MDNDVKEVREWINTGWPILLALLLAAASITTLMVDQRNMRDEIAEIRANGSPSVQLLQHDLSRMQSDVSAILSKLETHIDREK